MGIISACSLPLGTLTTLLWRPDDRSVGVLMAFGGGALLAALTIDLVGSALAKGEFYWLAIGCVIGGALFVALDNIVNSRGGFLRKSSTVVHYLRRQRRQRFKKALGDLERIDAFRDLPQEDIEDLASAAIHGIFEKGATIYSAGDPSDFFYVVEKGEVSVMDPRTQRHSPIVYRGRATPGQHAFITGSPHTHHAVATQICHVWMLPHEEFHRILVSRHTCYVVLVLVTFSSSHDGEEVGMKRYVVALEKEERDELAGITRKGSHQSQKVVNALILLNCDEGEFNEHRARGEAIAEILRISARKVDRVKKRFVEEGMEAALGGRQGRRSSYVRKADGEFEARLVALSCAEPPEGHSQWSLRLLADRVVELGHIDSVSHETVRRVLKKTQSSRGGASAG